MRNRRFRPEAAGMRRAIGLAFLVAIGCSPQEELKPDPGVSPFYPGPSAESKSPGSPRPAGGGAGSVAELAAAGGPAEAEAPLRPADVEKQLRIALRASEKGDLPRASALLDRIIALEPVNREALFGRTAVALAQAQKAATPGERLAAVEKAGAVARTLRRAYERPNQRELELYARVYHEEIWTNVAQDRIDRAVAALKDAYESGFDAIDAIEQDPKMAKLRSSPDYQALVKRVDSENLARARKRVADLFASTPNYVFDFKTTDLDGKPLSLDQFKGKVLLVDLWGTWCKPCRETIPGLIQLLHRHRRRGFDVIGLDYEQDVSDPKKTEQFVKQFVKESGIPYRIAMFDESLREKVPNVQGYPTTLLIDRAGKVRVQLTGGGAEALTILDAALEILLAEPEPGKAAPDKSEAGKAAPDKSEARTSREPAANRPR